MASRMIVEHAPSERPHTARRLLVAWQHPDSRVIAPVAALARDDPDGVFEFRYLRRAPDVEGFRPFVAFPDLYAPYRSDRLFPFFENRLMPRNRADYEDYMIALDLPVDADPFEVLARSAGRRATDTIEVFPEPVFDQPRQSITCQFLARGIRHLPGANEAIDDLSVNDRLSLMLDRQNPANHLAQLMRTDGFRLVGFVPDYLVEHVERSFSLGRDAVDVRVDHIGPPDGPRHFRLLCSLKARWPYDTPPFSGPEYQPITDDV